MIEKYAKPGISVNMLFPETLVNEDAQLDAFKVCCDFEKYEALDIFLPEDSVIRHYVLKLLTKSGKSTNYNAPPSYQDPQYDAGNADKTIRDSTLALIKRHIDFAAHSGSEIFVLPSCKDTGAQERGTRMEFFKDFMCQAAVYAEQYKITIILEPIERDRFKRMLLGPTFDCVEFVKDLQKKGCNNVQLMIDTAHLPLMGEDYTDALRYSKKVGLYHVHLGNAVLNKDNELYGHMHAPLDIQDGVYGFTDLVNLMSEMLELGFIRAEAKNKLPISYEIRPYPGVSPQVTAAAVYDMLDNALVRALARDKELMA